MLFVFYNTTGDKQLGNVDDQYEVCTRGLYTGIYTCR